LTAVTVGPAGLVWDGEEHLTLAGEVHYWRLERNHWRRVIETVRDLGFTVVSLYVPWAVHEVEPGVLDFGGARDVGAFLGVVADAGLKALVRIGPDTACEQETSGWPRWVVDDPSCQALRSNGQPYLLVTATGHLFPPSYASSTFLTHVRRWYEEIIVRLAPLQHPDGPIVACQLDNELGYHFQPNAYAMDYHPDAVASWRMWSGGRWANPPRDAADEPEERRLSWVTWKEHHRRDVLRTLAGWARDLGMDRVPLLHNDYPRTETPIDLGALENEGVVDWATADVYSTRQGGTWVRDVARHVAGSTRFPFLAELGAGWITLPWLLPVETSAFDEEVIALRAFLSGIRGANVYMLVERDRWYGSPVAADGTRREPQASLYPRLRRLLDEIEWLTMRRHAPVLLLENRGEHRRIAARDTLGGIVPCFSQLLPLDLRLANEPHPDTDRLRAWERGLAGALDAAGVDHDRATTSALPTALDRYEVVVVPTLRPLDGAVAGALERAAAAGTRVVCGPEMPAAPAPWATVLADPDELTALLPTPPVVSDAGADVDVHVWGNEHRTIVGTVNNTDRTITTALRSRDASPLRLRGLWRAGDAEDGVTLEPWEVQVWEVRT
jgi:beta-galactosidase